MKTLTVLTFVSVFYFFADAQYTTDNLKLDFKEQALTSQTFENLRLYPVFAHDVFREALKEIGNYTNLKEAIEKEKIVISEVSENGTVNSLYAENVSKDTVYIIAGEIVKGGKQDRMISQNIVLPPGEKVNLSAFCVERGRWSSASEDTAEFNGYFRVASSEIRSTAVKERNQSKVWEKVDKVTKENEAESSTGTYASLEDSDAYQESLTDYLKHFKGMFSADVNIIGVVAVSGNTVIGCDLFANHELFVAAFENLLYSYITEALTNGEAVSITNEQVQAYLEEFLQDEEWLEKNSLKINGKIMYCPKF